MQDNRINKSTSRRQFIQAAAAGGLVLGSNGLPYQAFANKDESKEHGEKPPSPLGKAEHCILIWLGGGAAQIDTWDPKEMGDPKKKKAGSYYPSIKTAIPGVEVCEHLPKCANILDRFNILRTVHHDVIDEHARATNRMHTGRVTSGTVTYPSIGSIIADQRGPVNPLAPAYILIGYPNVTRGPGFLGAKSGYVYLTDTSAGPSGFTRAADNTKKRQDRRERMLDQLRTQFRQNTFGGQTINDYDASLAKALRLSGPQFMNVFNLEKEPSDLRNSYGGEFGQRCLLSRRLIQSGVRFIEVSHNLNFINGTGWDTHNDGQLKQHLMIKELDTALSTLVTDLENHKLLDKTLVVVASEFGRPAQFDSGGGRGHHGKAFSVVMAGGGLNNGIAIGETDDRAMNIVSRPVSVPDMHATIHACLGIDPSHELYTPSDRPVPITDGGQAIAELFS